jgi:hypothetical protein
MANIPGWLSAIFGPVRIKVAGVLLGFQPRSTVNFVNISIDDDEANDETTITADTSGAPTGTGFPHITSGAQDAAAKLVENADVHASAAIAGSKIAPSFGSQAVTTTGLATVGGLVNTGIQTSSLTGTQHNFSLSADVNFVRLTGAAPVITGITGGTQGRRVVFHATAGNVTFNGQDTNSTAANRITTALSTVQCYQFCAIEFIYDGTSQRWVVMTGIAAPET